MCAGVTLYSKTKAEINPQGNKEKGQCRVKKTAVTE
jgi:hypothetical protein